MKKIIYLIITTAFLGCTSQENKIPENFDLGRTENGSYQNDFFKMEILFDPNWIIQDKKQMNDLIEKGKDLVVGENEDLENALKAAQVNTAYLLTIFKYEVGAAVEFNPSFLVVAENTKNSPGIKNGKDYLFHAKNLLKQTQLKYYFEKEVFEKSIGGSTFHIMEAKLDYMGKTIIQDYITTVSKGFSLSFIVSYTTEEEKAELYEILENIRI